MSDVVGMGYEVLDRMVRAVELVRERLLRTASALEGAGIPYRVIDGNAAAAWVAQVNPRAVRNTVDVDILLRREDLPAAAEAMTAGGFRYRHAAGIDFFLDGPNGGFEEWVHVVKAGELVRKDDLLPAPELTDAVEGDEYRFLSLEALVRMKLTSFRKKDQVHLEDLLSAKLIDATWVNRVPPELSARLRTVIEEMELPPDLDELSSDT